MPCSRDHMTLLHAWHTQALAIRGRVVGVAGRQSIQRWHIHGNKTCCIQRRTQRQVLHVRRSVQCHSRCPLSTRAFNQIHVSFIHLVRCDAVYNACMSWKSNLCSTTKHNPLACANKLYARHRRPHRVATDPCHRHVGRSRLCCKQPGQRLRVRCGITERIRDAFQRPADRPTPPEPRARPAQRRLRCAHVYQTWRWQRCPPDQS